MAEEILGDLKDENKVVIEKKGISQDEILWRWHEVELSSEDEKKISDMLTKYIDESNNGRVKLLEKIEKWNNMYEGIVKDKTFPWKDCSNIAIPLPAIITEALQVRLSSLVTNTNAPFMATGVEGGDYDTAEKQEDYVNYLVTKKMKAIPTLIDSFGLIAKEGTVGVEVFWKRETRRVRDIEEYEVEVKVPAKVLGMKLPYSTTKTEKRKRLVEKNKVIYNAPYWDIVELKDLIFPPDAKDDINKWRYVGRLLYLAPDDLKRLEKKHHFKYIEDSIKLPEKDERQVQAIKEDKEGLNTGVVVPWQIPIYKIWCGFDINGDELEEECVFYFDYRTKKVLYASLLPYYAQVRPIKLLRVLKRANRPLGIGMPEAIDNLAEEINTQHNTRNDNGSICTAKVCTYIEGSGFDPSKHEIYPGAFLPVQSHEDVKVLEMGDVKYSSFNEESLTQRYIESRTALGSYQVGKEAPGDLRAPMGKTLALIGQSNIKVDFYATLLNYDIADLLELTLMLCEQYYPEEIEYEILGEEAQRGKPLFGKITRDQIRTQVDYILSGSTSTTNKSIQQQNDMAAYQLITTNPAVAQNPEILYEVTIDLLRNLGKKSLVNKLEKMKDSFIMQQKMMLEKAQQGKQNQETKSGTSASEIPPEEMEQDIAALTELAGKAGQEQAPGENV